MKQRKRKGEILDEGNKERETSEVDKRRADERVRVRVRGIEKLYKERISRILKRREL